MDDQDLDWMVQRQLTLPENLHKMPKHSKKLLTKFYCFGTPTMRFVVKLQQHIGKVVESIMTQKLGVVVKA